MEITFVKTHSGGPYYICNTYPLYAPNFKTKTKLVYEYTTRINVWID